MGKNKTLCDFYDDHILLSHLKFLKKKSFNNTTLESFPENDLTASKDNNVCSQTSDSKKEVDDCIITSHSNNLLVCNNNQNLHGDGIT